MTDTYSASSSVWIRDVQSGHGHGHGHDRG